MRTAGTLASALVGLGLLLAECGLAGAAGDAAELGAEAGGGSETTLLCDCDDCERGREPFWFAGTEMTFLDAEIAAGGRATMTVNDSDTAGTDLSLVGAQGVDSFGYAPRMWLGRQFGERWAVVGRFWTLDESISRPPSPPAGAVNLTNFLTLADSSHAELYNVDLEGVRSFEFGRWKLDGSVGARFASFSTDATLSSFGVFTAGNFLQLSLSSASSFDGAGVTGGLVARRQLGDSPLYLFLSGRGSSMGGTAVSYARVVGTLAVPPSNPLIGAATVTRVDDEAVLNVGEFQAGLQWEFELACLPVNGFFRTTFEYQHWNIDAPPVGGAGFGGTLNDITVNSFVRANHGDASLVGFGFALGFTW